MASHHHPRQAKIEEFSLPLFAFTVIVTFAALLALLWLVAPNSFATQFHAPVWKILVIFAGMSLVTCFVEYFFHRYVLHQPAIPFLRRLYRQHTLHHGLTRITRKHRPTGPHLLVVVENKFPIVEIEQGEASFFPWFTLAIFAGLLTPLLILGQWLMPSYPWFLGGYLALVSSLTLYELLHAINHWPIEKWLPLVESRHWKWFWHPVYSFHLRHHAVIDCNESISGFFGIPLADWVFGTCVIPKSIYADGDEWQESEFTRPRPYWLIRVMDQWAVGVVQKRRQAAKNNVVEKTQEEINLAVSKMAEASSSN